MNWPNDADGDVLRRLQEDDFNFAVEYKVDFNIDFDHWPLSKDESNLILQYYPDAEFIDPDKEDLKSGKTLGYVLVVINSVLSYEFVTQTQDEISRSMASIGGVCESWGVLHG